MPNGFSLEKELRSAHGQPPQTVRMSRRVLIIYGKWLNDAV